MASTLDEDDAVLLERFARDKSGEAFAALVRRYVDLVHSSAMRQVREPAMAEDVTQVVFILLARKAGSIAAAHLPGWLFNTTRHAARSCIRMETRLKNRERIAAELHADQTEPERPPEWIELSKELDEAVAWLGRGERDVILLHYFNGLTLVDAAKRLGITPEAARKRSARAIERLRDFFKARGTVLPAASIGALITAHSVQAAPSAVAASVVSAGGLAAGSVAGASVGQIVMEVSTSMRRILAFKLASTAAAALLAAASLGLVLQNASRTNGQAVATTAPAAAASSAPAATEPALAPPDFSDVKSLHYQILIHGPNVIGMTRAGGQNVAGKASEVDTLAFDDGSMVQYTHRGPVLHVHIMGNGKRELFAAGGKLVGVAAWKPPRGNVIQMLLSPETQLITSGPQRDAAADLVIEDDEKLRCYVLHSPTGEAISRVWVDARNRVRRMISGPKDDMEVLYDFNPAPDPVARPTTRPADAETVPLDQFGGLLATRFPTDGAIYVHDEGGMRFAVHELSPTPLGSMGLVCSVRILDPARVKKHNTELQKHGFKQEWTISQQVSAAQSAVQVEQLAMLSDMTTTVGYFAVVPVGDAVGAAEYKFSANITCNDPINTGALESTQMKLEFSARKQVVEAPERIDAFIESAFDAVGVYDPFCVATLQGYSGKEDIRDERGQKIWPNSRAGEIDKETYLKNIQTRMATWEARARRGIKGQL